MASLASVPSGAWSVEDEAVPPSSRARAQERAFRHWAIPGAKPPSPLDASDPAQPAEESFEQGVPSFRVYTPAELANRPIRQNKAPAKPASLVDEIYDGLVRVRHAGPKALLKWLAIGIAVGAGLLTALVVIGNLTDDTRVPATQRAPYSATLSPSTKLVPPYSTGAPATTSTTVAAPANPATDDANDTAFELPDENAHDSAPAGQPRTSHPRAARASAAGEGSPRAPKKKAEVRIMRNAPF